MSRFLPLLLLVLALCTAHAPAQGPALPESRGASAAPVQPSPRIVTPVTASATELRTHRFFDRHNALLFAGATAGRTADLLTTWRFRDRGYTEVVLSNDFVDNRAAFAAYSYGAVAANIGAAYALHRLGWHKAERALTVVHISYTGALAIHNYRLVP